MIAVLDLISYIHTDLLCVCVLDLSMQLDDFEHVCATNDEKLMNHLNQQFRNTELNYGHEQLGSKRIPREAAVDTSVRKTQVS